MAYISGDLVLMSVGNGYGHYRYDTLDQNDVVEDAGYFNNVDDNLALVVGDKIEVWTWATALRSGTISEYKKFTVTNVIANDAASSAGAVNIAEIGLGGGGVSSGD